MTDPIADMLTRIRNANQNRASSVVIPTSKVKEEIAKILKDEGFIEDYTIDGEGVQKNITLTFSGILKTLLPIRLIISPYQI